jgi:4-hydroxybenzoyl-CoA reductase subunit beta
MMRLPPFRFLAPATLDEAVRLLAEAGPTAKLVAGGTDLYPNMKRLQVAPTVVIGLHNVAELTSIRPAEAGGLVIGAGMTLTRLEKHTLIRQTYPSLVDAIATISTPLLRNMGTLGGNLCLDTRCHYLNQSFFWRQGIGSCMKAEGDICRVAPGSSRCWAITSADLPPLLIALGADVRLVGPKGERTFPLAELYRNDGIEYLAKAPDEILAEVILPPPNGTRSAYLKLRRRGTFDFPALGVAAALDIDGAGVCESARIVLGAVTSFPLVMEEAETLVGEKFTPELIESVAEAMMRQAKPLHLADYNHYYRKQMVSLYVKRVLTQLTDPIPESVK